MGAEPELAREFPCGGDHRRVVRRQGVIGVAREQLLHQNDVIAIHLRLVLKGHACRFFVRALAQTYSRAALEEFSHILLTAAEVRLDNNS